VVGHLGDEAAEEGELLIERRSVRHDREEMGKQEAGNIGRSSYDPFLGTVRVDDRIIRNAR
jgi:hypothetical protein